MSPTNGAHFETRYYRLMNTKKISFLFLLAAFTAFTIQAQTSNLSGKKTSTKAKTSKKSTTATSGTYDFVEPQKNGSINWTDQYIEAEGNSVMDPERFKLPSQARLMAQRGAIVDAQRNLLEIVNGVLVEGQTTVKDLVVESDEVKTKVSGMLKGAVQVGKTVYGEGTATVRLRIPLYKDGLAEAVDTTSLAPVDPVPANVVPAPSDSLPSNVVLAVQGNYQPRLFPKLNDSQNQMLWDLAQAFDPTNGKAPSLVKKTQQALEALKGKKGTEVLDVVQDQLGNLVLNKKSSEKIEKWKKIGLTIWKVVKTLILPI